MKFDIEKLAQTLQENCPEVIFALLHGSAKDGQVNPGSDVDIALYLKGKPAFETITKAMAALHSLNVQLEPDIGILNNTEPVYRFEALKGKLLFARDHEAYLKFFSLTCRQYESQIADYQRQHRYRLINKTATESPSAVGR